MQGAALAEGGTVLTGQIGSLPSGNLQPNSGQSPGTLRGLKGWITEARCVKQNGDFNISEQRISPSDHGATVFA